jgi:hypothetical protein
MLPEPSFGKRILLLLFFSSVVATMFGMAVARGRELQQQTEQSPTQTAGQTAPSVSDLPRGHKLILKDGSFQLVREYKIEGDRVRYYSLERSQWEEMPASLVDWQATKKVEAEGSQQDQALLAKVHAQEQARLAMPLDIDASLEAAPGVFLPPGEGMFVFDNKAILRLPPAEPTYKTDKKREIEKVLSPVPLVSARQFVLISGAHAKLRIKNDQPEFYMRTKQDSEPDLELVTAKVQETTREIGSVKELFKQQTTTMHTLLMQRWEIAKGVYRFTLGQTLRPGEYALVEVIEPKTELEQLNMYIWDFGVDPAPRQRSTCN